MELGRSINHTGKECVRTVGDAFSVDAGWIVPANLRPRECFYVRRGFAAAADSIIIVRITAYPAFRMWLDGNWIGDGPARGWPHSYYFEEYEVRLAAGEHELLVLVHDRILRGMVHQPEALGCCADVSLFSPGETPQRFVTDTDWKVAVDYSRQRHVPCIFPLAGRFESVDARYDWLEWHPPATVAHPLCAPDSMRLRDVMPPRQTRLNFGAPSSSAVLADPGQRYVVPVRSLVRGDRSGDISIHSAMAFGLLGEIELSEEKQWPAGKSSWRWFMGGKEVQAGAILAPGRHAMAAFSKTLLNHLADIAWDLPDDLSSSCSHWWVIGFPSLEYMEEDIVWHDHAEEYRSELEQSYRDEIENIGIATADPKKLEALLRGRIKRRPQEEIFRIDPHAEFMGGTPRATARFTATGDEVSLPLGNEGELTELHFDLGSIRSGFLEFEVSAAEGTRFDLFGIEHMRADGVRQHTDKPNCNRNGLRYIARGGRQKFMSTVLRPGRHWFLRVHNPGGPVVIHQLGIVESGYPARKVGHFECAEPKLTQMWQVAERTIQLCSDDVFVDSLYEQALWIGDAYGEQLYALNCWDARDIALRSLRLGADSLRDFPMVTSQVPSSWNSFIPVWSMLWGYSVLDYHFYTGDRRVLEILWPDFRRNLHGLLFHVNEHGLFDAPFWNLFEWADIDWRHRVVLINSFFLAGLLDRGAAIARELGARDNAIRWESTARKIRWALGRLWDNDRDAYPDSVPTDQSRALRFSIHTQFLALLHGAAGEPSVQRLLDLVDKPPPDFATVASPFALQFLYEALDKHGRSSEILDSMRAVYGGMLAGGADTFWEALPGSTISPDGFPTRSHCHGWAAAPVYFLPRIILGIRQTAAGGTAYTVRPFVRGLHRASGTVAGALGPVEVAWEKATTGRLLVIIRHPEGSKVRFEKDASVEAEGLVPHVEFWTG